MVDVLLQARSKIDQAYRVVLRTLPDALCLGKNGLAVGKDIEIHVVVTVNAVIKARQKSFDISKKVLAGVELVLKRFRGWVTVRERVTLFHARNASGN